MRRHHMLLLLSAGSLALTLCMVHYLYSSDTHPTIDAQLSALPPIEELNDPQNNGFRKIAHFGAKAEDVNRGNDFWKRSGKVPKAKVMDGVAFGEVDFFGGEEKEKENYPVKSETKKNVASPTSLPTIPPKANSSNLSSGRNENFVGYQNEKVLTKKMSDLSNPENGSFDLGTSREELWMRQGDQEVPEIEDIYPVKAKKIPPTQTVVTESAVNVAVNDSTLKSYFAKIPKMYGENIIAMSLYGSNPRYTMGAVRNAELIQQNFPGWKLRIYTEAPSETPRFGVVPQMIISKLKELSVDIHFMLPGEGFIPPMMWRFLVADDLWVDRFIIRDSDARLTDRDAAAVYAWVQSEQPFNCIRDHPSHAGFAISGGMWGARPQMLNNILRRSWKDMMRGVRQDYLQDMNFLNYVVWPKVQSHAYCSDSVSCDQWPGAHPFPVPRLGYEHVGQVVNEHDLGRPDDIRILRTAGENQKCVPNVNIRDLLQKEH